MELLQTNRSPSAPPEAERVHRLLTQIKKYRWLGLEAEAEKLATELALLQSDVTMIEPQETD